MSTNVDNLAKKLRSLYVEVSDLTYVYNDITDKYVQNFDELEKPNHPIAKLSNSLDALNNITRSMFETLLSTEHSDNQALKKSLQKLATIDALKDGDTEFVSFVRRYLKD